MLTLLNFALATPPPGGIGSIHVSLNQPVTDEISIIHDATIVNAAKAEIQERPWAPSPMALLIRTKTARHIERAGSNVLRCPHEKSPRQ